MNKIKDSLPDFFETFYTEKLSTYNLLFSDYSPSTLDIMLLSKCGERYASYIVDNHTTTIVIDTVLYMYMQKWSKIKDILIQDYNAFDTFRQNTTDTTTVVGSDNNTSQSTDINMIVGFDSQTPTENEKTTNENVTTNSKNESVTISKTTTGNNGNVINADIINKEIETRKQAFLNIVFGDIQNVIALNIY